MLALPLWFLKTQTQHQQSNGNMELMRLIRGAFTVSPSVAASPARSVFAADLAALLALSRALSTCPGLPLNFGSANDSSQKRGTRSPADAARDLSRHWILMSTSSRKQLIVTLVGMPL